MAEGATIPSSRSAWLKAAAFLAASWFAVAALALQARPGSEVVAIAFPPWWSTQQSMLAAASADAAIVRTTAVPSLLVVHPNQAEGLARLRAAGAWLAIDPQAIAACFTNKM
jgi:hypothetical protein